MCFKSFIRKWAVSGIEHPLQSDTLTFWGLFELSFSDIMLSQVIQDKKYLYSSPYFRLNVLGQSFLSRGNFFIGTACVCVCRKTPSGVDLCNLVHLTLRCQLLLPPHQLLHRVHLQNHLWHWWADSDDFNKTGHNPDINSNEIYFHGIVVKNLFVLINYANRL